MKTSPAVFLDRDGTLMEEANYCSRPEDVRVFLDVPDALVKLKKAGFLTIIITNQAGIGRGYFTEEDFQKVQVELFRQMGSGLIDATYFCPDHPERATARRKPGIGMIEEARRDLEIDLSGSWFIGDKSIDVACGKAAGLRTILVETGYGKNEALNAEADFQAGSFSAAVDWILSSRRSQ